ncbi:aminotransferase class I/II-fold pyridoxal phosphate-dependent enzyme, partial [Salmonella enterica]|uniref:aminotransferase class I/II-fold pyridoxal phosphate-dependent enzyme n=1 Tax=Salmonella enterica TaxID=28901 RepID=UPI003D2E51A8
MAEAEADRAAALGWLAGGLPGIAADRVVVCPGVQGALTVLLTTLTRPGDLICAEDLTYPGIIAAAGQFGLRLRGVPLDRDGMDPAAFAEICAAETPRLLYCTPTLHNPTAATMPGERRAALVAIARRHGVVIVEDDIYGPLPEDGPPPL